MTASFASSGPVGVGALAHGHQRPTAIASSARPRADLVDIVICAHRRGFCRWRVATALEASQDEVALVDARIAAGPGRDHEEIVDVGRIVGGLHGLRAAGLR